MTILWALCSVRLCWTIWLTHNIVEDKALGERLGDPEAKALIVALAATAAEVEAETFADTIGKYSQKYSRSLSRYQRLLLRPLQYTKRCQGR